MNALHDYIKRYVDYVGLCESPTQFTVWSAISIVGAVLGRNVSVKFGHKTIYPNMYILLVGPPASMKSYALDIGKDLLSAAGYSMFAPNKAAKETIWAKLEKSVRPKIKENNDDWNFDLSAISLKEMKEVDTAPREMYIAHGELADFIGDGNEDLIQNLTNLWDCLDVFDNPKLTRKSVIIPKPTINMLGGMTPGGLGKIFGNSANEGGFFSRAIFVYGSKSADLKITFPSSPLEEDRIKLIMLLKKLYNFQGEFKFSKTATQALYKIYCNSSEHLDASLSFLLRRKQQHIIKTAMCLAATKFSLTIEEEDIIIAYTLVTYNEEFIPNIFSSYGTAKNTNVQGRIHDMIKHSKKPVTKRELWKAFSQDLSKLSDLDVLLLNLAHAEKIQKVSSKAGQTLGYIGWEKEEKKEEDMMYDKSIISWIRGIERWKEQEAKKQYANIMQS